MEKVSAKNNWQIALGVFGRTIVAAIIGVFLYLSVSTVCATLATEDIGYALWHVNEDGSTELISEHRYTDEDYTEDIELADDQMTTRLYSEMPAGVALAGDIITQIGSIIILAAFPYRYLWEQGTHDRNAVNCGNAVEDKWRGIKVGLIADAPAILVYLLLWLGKLGVPFLVNSSALYTIFNSSFLPFTYRVVGTLTTAPNLTIGQMLLLILPVLVLPIICHVAYTLGRREFVLSDKVFYKSKKKKRRRR